MQNQFERTELLLGTSAMEKLKNSRVAVFGAGGVGGHTIEAFARCGIGTIDIIDNDTISLSNINRQIFALHSTIGEYKVDIAKKRIADINSDATVNTYKTFFLPENAHEFDFAKYDYIIDAIDTVTAKIELVMRADEAGVPIISSMGTGNKLDPTLFEVTDIYKTSVCPLAKIMRYELRKRGIKKLKVLYSKEMPVKPANTENGRIPASCSFVPSVAGLIIAGEVIRNLTI